MSHVARKAHLIGIIELAENPYRDVTEIEISVALLQPNGVEKALDAERPRNDFLK